MQYEADVHDCGYHWSVANDLENVFAPEYRVCRVCQGAARVARHQDSRDRAFRDANKDHPASPDPADGRHMVMRLMSPYEAEQWRASQSSQSTGGPPLNARSARS